METTSLYADWKKIYPRYQSGFFRSLRLWVYGLELAIFFLLPWMRWDRPAGLPDQAVLFDLPGRKFYIFSLEIWPQDIFLLAFLLIAAAIGLFFMTALAGRVFCGYMCFQTVWTDWFLLVEKIFEGNRNARMKFDHAPWSGRKAVVKIGKHGVWLLVSAWTGMTFVLYFGDAPQLLGQFLDGSVPFAAWFTFLFLTVTTYIMAGFAREQVCIYMCPYARFQGVMFDEDTIIVAYHPELGEPREANRRKRNLLGAQVGACIDCDSCVTVCPTGIDIRNGQQYECITCGACIDACDSVRAKVGMASRLIRYTSLREMRSGKTQWLRGRILVYTALLSIFLGGIVYYLASHVPVEFTVIGHRQPLYILQSDGSIQNNYTVRVLNMTATPQSYVLTMSGLAGTRLTIGAVETYSPEGAPVLEVAPGSVTPFTAYVRQESAHVESGRRDIVFHLRAVTPQGGEASYQSVFMRP
ncbi:MAG: cytochrome c oxidase accessory protein CcoG [Magnetococcales bacterium]|nr:cytochrome c oxidase accessory protein CcoG [Magnetococcales bacterium]NGZ06898.1 cytochrome c oxidase accessory protein CcoG [Magnetococcales bacterium]